MSKQYPHLFDPLVIRGHHYRNRILTGPTLFAEFIFNPEYSENVYRMVERRAKGGAAEVTTGELTLNDHNAENLFNQKIDINELEGPVFDAFGEYANRIKKYGAVALLELCNSGGPVEEYTEDRMAAVCDTFRRGAVFARKAGFDGVLIHGGHGFLLQQFISPLTNHRTDEYGGSMENRAKFPIRILKSLREGLGEDGILEMRFSAQDGVEGGMTIEDSCEYFRLIDGLPDIIHVSNGLKNKGSRTYTFTDIYDDHGHNIQYAAKAKAVVKKSKVAVIGGINDPQQCEEAIADGKTDFVILSRQAIADPEFPNKACQGREDQIRRCIRCFNCYPGPREHETEEIWPPPGGLPAPSGPPPFGQFSFFECPNPLEAMLEALASDGLNIGECTINPTANLRVYPELFPEVTESRKVLVIGGGPGGMQAAITAAERGHQVTLVECSGKLGGVLTIMKHDKDKADLYGFMTLLENEVTRLGVDVKLHCNDAEEMIRGDKFDHVVIAVGGRSKQPKVPGAQYAVDVIEACTYPEKLGENVVMVGSGLSGCESAIFLAKKGKKVTVLARRDRLAPECTGLARTAMLDEMDKVGIRQLLKHTTLEIYRDGVEVIGPDGMEQRLTADSVVYATGTEPGSELAEHLASVCAQMQIRCSAIGDCIRSGKVLHATREGYVAAMLIN